MKKRTVIIAFLLIACIPAFTMVYEPDKLRVHIRLDKKTFYADEDINLQVCVKNISEKKNYFEVYDASEQRVLRSIPHSSRLFLTCPGERPKSPYRIK